jgi:hypothetical protein
MSASSVIVVSPPYKPTGNILNWQHTNHNHSDYKLAHPFFWIYQCITDSPATYSKDTETAQNRKESFKFLRHIISVTTE